MKYVIKNCKSLISNDICELYSQKGIHLSSYCYCKDKNCLLKKIVEKCREADGKVVGYTKGKVYDSDAEKLIEKDIPLITKNPLAEEILDLLDIEECE